MTAPPVTSECPPIYFVVLWTIKSAPRSSGVCRIGVANVLSTTSLAPASCVIRAIALMSRQRSSGLVGDSSQTIFVLPSMSLAKAAGEVSSVNTGVMP